MIIMNRPALWDNVNNAGDDDDLYAELGGRLINNRTVVIMIQESKLHPMLTQARCDPGALI